LIEAILCLWIAIAVIIFITVKHIERTK